MKKWRCKVCGYIHTGEEPPDKCPVCGAPKSAFELVEEEKPSADRKPDSQETNPPADSDRTQATWVCQVCGYVHHGTQPPEKCPLCGVPEENFERRKEETDPTLEEPRSSPGAVDSEGLTDTIKPVRQLAARAELLTKLHGHPISVHIPNGLLPVTIFFTLLAVVFQSETLAIAARYNCIFVCLSMPLVLISGFIDWFNRFDGHLTGYFKIKITCGLIVTGLTLVLALWWVVDPHIYLSGKSGRALFLALNFLAFVPAVVAGYYGGKLVFRE